MPWRRPGLVGDACASRQLKDGYGDFFPTTTRPVAHTILLYTSWGCLESLRSHPYSTVDPRYDLGRLIQISRHTV